MSKKKYLIYDEGGEKDKSSPKVPRSGKAKWYVSSMHEEAELEKALQGFIGYEIPEDILEDFGDDIPIYRPVLDFLNRKRILKAFLEIFRQDSAQMRVDIFNYLVKRKERNRLTPEEEELLESFLNEKTFDGSSIWFPNPPEQEIEEGGEKI